MQVDQRNTPQDNIFNHGIVATFLSGDVDLKEVLPVLEDRAFTIIVECMGHTVISVYTIFRRNVKEAFILEQFSIKVMLTVFLTKQHSFFCKVLLSYLVCHVVVLLLVR